MVIKKDKLITANLILIFKKWQIRYRETKNLSQFTINFRKSHHQPQRTLQLVCEDRVLFVCVDLHVSLCWQQDPKCEPAIRLVYPTFISVNAAVHPAPHTHKIPTDSNARFTQLYLVIIHN